MKQTKVQEEHETTERNDKIECVSLCVSVRVPVCVDRWSFWVFAR